VTTKVLDAGRGYAGSPATKRKSISTDGPNYQRIEGGIK